MILFSGGDREGAAIPVNPVVVARLVRVAEGLAPIIPIDDAIPHIEKAVRIRVVQVVAELLVRHLVGDHAKRVDANRVQGLLARLPRVVMVSHLELAAGDVGHLQPVIRDDPQLDQRRLPGQISARVPDDLPVGSRGDARSDIPPQRPGRHVPREPVVGAALDPDRRRVTVRVGQVVPDGDQMCRVRRNRPHVGDHRRPVRSRGPGGPDGAP